MSSLRVRIIAITSIVLFAMPFGCSQRQDPGGVEWVLGVDLDRAVELELEYLASSVLQAHAESDGFNLKSLSVEGTRLVVETSSRQAEGGLAARVADGGGLRIASQTPGRFELVLTEDWSNEVQERAMSQVLGVLRRRLADSIGRSSDMSRALEALLRRVANRVLGIPDWTVTRQGYDRVLARISGGKIDRSRVRSLLAVTGFLEFKLVQDQASSDELLRARYPEAPPAGTEIVYERDPETRRVVSAYLVSKTPGLTGEYLEDARIGFDRQGRALIGFHLDPAGARIFEQLTGGNIGAQLAIVFDGRVYSAPIIRSRISSYAQIEGRFTPREAADLAVVLRAGALAVPVVILEERAFGGGRAA